MPPQAFRSVGLGERHYQHYFFSFSSFGINWDFSQTAAACCWSICVQKKIANDFPLKETAAEKPSKPVLLLCIWRPLLAHRVVPWAELLWDPVCKALCQPSMPLRKRQGHWCPSQRQVYGPQHPLLSYSTVVGKQIACSLTLLSAHCQGTTINSPVCIVLLLKRLSHPTDKTTFKDDLKIIPWVLLLSVIYVCISTYEYTCVLSLSLSTVIYLFF